MSLCKIEFRVKCYTSPHEHVRISCGVQALGDWNIQDSLACKTDEQLFPFWVSSNPVYLPRGTEQKLKVVIVDDCGNVIRWEQLEPPEKTSFDFGAFDGNRTYVIKYYQVLLEIVEGLYHMNDKVILKFYKQSKFSGGRSNSPDKNIDQNIEKNKRHCSNEIDYSSKKNSPTKKELWAMKI